MCGICGSLSLASHPVDDRPVREMLAGLRHRGPDGEGIMTGAGLVAGMRRLAVIDIEGGDQPISSEDGDVQVVFNGEIYNFREIRHELERTGHRFRTRSDTEVLVHLWEEHGPEMLSHLNGMFTFCIHRGSTGETFIARDRLGIKPLYYRLSGDSLLFASEIGVLAGGSEVDHQALLELFCLQYLAGGRTVYRAIRKLLPGHAIHVKKGEARIYRYYSLPELAPDQDKPVEEWVAELYSLLHDAVRCRTVADVPLGMFLSGGIDSTVILNLLAGESDHPVKTFSVGFSEEAAHDERRYARMAAERFGADHHELVVSAADIARHLPELVEHAGEPVMDPALIPTWLLSRYARREVTVVLTGEGADELFGGYRRYGYQHRYGRLGSLPGLGTAARSGIGGVLPGRMAQALEALAEKDPAVNHLKWASTVSGRIAGRLFGEDGYRSFIADSASRLKEHFAGGVTRLAGHLRVDQHEWLPHDLLAKVDAASMAHSLEARVPFLDHRLAEWASGLPDSLRIDDGLSKVVLRRAFNDAVPAEIVERPKRGFDLPLDSWIRGPLRPMAEELLVPERLTRWPGIDAAEVGAMLDEHVSGKKDYGLPLFCILSTMIFLEKAA